MKTAETHPGGLLRDCVLPALDLSVSQVARDLQITRQSLHRILARQAAITPDMAVRLEKLCGVPSQYWLSRQQSYELVRVRELNRQLLSLIPSHQLPANVLDLIGACNVR